VRVQVSTGPAALPSRFAALVLAAQVSRPWVVRQPVCSPGRALRPLAWAASNVALWLSEWAG